MRQPEPLVYLVDDDASFRRSTERLIESAGFKVKPFSSAPDFLRSKPSEGAACLVLDVQLPGLSGLDLQRELTKRGSTMPIIFVTGHGDIPMSVRAMKAGAVEFLTKPFRERDLIDALEQALKHKAQRLTPRRGKDGRRSGSGEIAFRVAFGNRHRLVLGRRTAGVRRILPLIQSRHDCATQSRAPDDRKVAALDSRWANRSRAAESIFVRTSAKQDRAR